MDTKYFRSDLTESEDKNKHYQPNIYGNGTLLGNIQWQWLKNELNSSMQILIFRLVVFSFYQTNVALNVGLIFLMKLMD
ncbi:hypothetical protein RXV94_10405 [Yeosuana sp. MJ-SS3]|uniref:Uncharacterized protein n=1 Tax=Gilvirhabdus luticola TaxID=3079858 RepID=A0ABU3U8E6_9FLAO|nr:hypothetical protein [Yeosuana sp. MJ-SS3]MDU8886571.1 hypothetical protein [Yeosuana sp. MJ-SS3]